MHFLSTLLPSARSTAIYTPKFLPQSCFFALLLQNQERAISFCFNNMLRLQLFATSAAGPAAFATPLIVFDDFCMKIP